MSRKYEGLIVFNMKGNALTLDELIKQVGSEMEEEGAKISETKDLGRREFAYESNHLKAGQYVNFFFTAEPPVIKSIRERLGINENVHYQYYKVLG